MDDFYWYWLCNISGIGGEKIRKLLNVCDSAENIYRMKESVMGELGVISKSDAQKIINSKKNSEIYREYKELTKKGIQFISCKNSLYPDRLKELIDYPVALYVKGKLPDSSIPSVAIVGARACTEYGRQCSYELSASFAGMGIQVISGMALGIDAAAHNGSIKGGGYTCAVLGCGVDICYPRENIGLYMKMIQSGGIVSEYVPGTSPHAGQFPVRNRIISGLADVVVVIEARKKSGSLITVDQALEQNKDIMVVPGRITDRLSEGCNNLIKMGAQMITVPEDILANNRIAEYVTQRKNNSLKKDQINKNEINKVKSNIYIKEYEKNEINKEISIEKREMLENDDKYKVLMVLGNDPVSLEEIIEKTGLSFGRLSVVLLQMQLNGEVIEMAKNCYIKTHFL